MPRGLTYFSRSQAETAKNDWLTKGYTARIEQIGTQEWRVIIGEGIRTPTPEEEQTAMGFMSPEEQEEEELRADIRKEQRREEIKRTGKEEETRVLEEKEPKAYSTWRKLYKKGIVKQPYDEWLREDPEKRRMDMELALGKQGKELEKKYKDTSEKLLGQAVGGFGNTVSTMGERTHVKAGMKGAIQGISIRQPGGIAEVQRPAIGSTGIGAERPAIAKVHKPDLNKIETQDGSLIMAEPTESPIKQKSLGSSLKMGTPYLKKRMNEPE